MSDDPVGLEEMLAKNKCVNKYFDEVALQVSNLQTNQEPWILEHLSGASNPCLLLVLNTLVSDQILLTESHTFSTMLVLRIEIISKQYPPPSPVV